MLKDVFPFARLHKQAASLTVALELFQLEAEQKHFPEGFEPDRRIVALATEEARTYFLITYDLEAKP